MRRVVCTELGSLDNLVVEEVDPLVPAAHQVVVDVEAAGATYVDALMAKGGYQIKPPTPFCPGGEVAGRVSALGDDVTGYAPGDRVLAFCGLGGFADQVALPATSLVPLPEGLSAPVAATLVQSYATMVFAFTRRILTQPGESVLVLGAGGGIGLAAIDVAKALGLEAIAAASSEEKLAAAKAAGADTTIDYGVDDLRERLRARPERGVDIVVDPVGAPYAEPALRSLRPGGRYLVIGFTGGQIPRMPANHVLLNNRAVVGVDWGAWSAHEPEANKAIVGEVVAMVADGRLHPAEPATRPSPRRAAPCRRSSTAGSWGRSRLVP